MGRKSKSTPIADITVSFWKDMKKVNEVSEITIGEVVDIIQSDKLRNTINKIRRLRRKDEANDNRNHSGVLQYELSKPVKEKLPSIISSGIFKSRSKKGLVEYKGIMAIDYDHIPKNEIEALRQELNQNKYVYTVFTSPSGEGLKVLVRTDATPETHRDTYLQWGEQFPNQYWDKNVHDFSRLMFLSWDPLIQTNDDAETFKHVVQSVSIEGKDKSKGNARKSSNRSKSFESRDLASVLENVIPQLPSHYADERISWIAGINALISEFGEGARELAHLFSSASSKYSREETDKAFDYELKNFSPEGAKIGTFVYWASSNKIPFYSEHEMLFKEGKTVKQVAEELSITEDEARVIKEGIKEKVKTPVVAIEYLAENHNFGTNIITGQVVDRDTGDPVNPNDVYVELLTAGYDLNVSQVNAMCRSTVIAKKFDPFKLYFESLENRDVKGSVNIDKLSDCVILSDETQREFFRDMFRKHLIRAAGAAMDASVNRFMFILTDNGRENIGKSSLFRWLGGNNILKQPIHALAEYYSEQPISVNKDTELSLTEAFIYNIEELEEMNPKELAHFKQIISKSRSRIRRPYAANHEVLSRRCTFFASTNNDEFLAEGKNTRYLVFGVDHIDWSYEQDIDVNDVWAEAYKMWKENVNAGDLSQDDYGCQLTMNEVHKVGDPLEDYIDDITNPGGDWLEINAHPLQQAMRNNRVYKSHQQMGRVIKSMPDRIKKTKHNITRRSVYMLKTTIGLMGKIFNDADMANDNPYLADDDGRAYMSNKTMDEVMKSKPNF